MNTYTWLIDLTECFVNKDGMEKAIKIIYVSAIATNGTTPVRENLSVELDLPNPASFIPFEEVSNETAINWVFSKLGAEKAATELRLDELIDRVENPETIFLPLNN